MHPAETWEREKPLQPQRLVPEAPGAQRQEPVAPWSCCATERFIFSLRKAEEEHILCSAWLRYLLGSSIPGGSPEPPDTQTDRHPSVRPSIPARLPEPGRAGLGGTARLRHGREPVAAPGWVIEKRLIPVPVQALPTAMKVTLLNAGRNPSALRCRSVMP